MSSAFEERIRRIANEHLTPDIWPNGITEEKRQDLINQIVLDFNTRYNAIQETLDANPYVEEGTK